MCYRTSIIHNKCSIKYLQYKTIGIQSHEYKINVLLNLHNTQHMLYKSPEYKINVLSNLHNTQHMLYKSPQYNCAIKSP
jgi:hypothetical protein